LVCDGKNLEAVPIAKIVARISGETVGWVYRWNTGETAELWLKSKLGPSEVTINKPRKND
jgi:hypothetical protein